MPLCFETNSEATVRAPTSGMPDGASGWLPSCPSTHPHISTAAVPDQPANLGQNCSEGGGY